MLLLGLYQPHPNVYLQFARKTQAGILRRNLWLRLSACHENQISYSIKAVHCHVGRAYSGMVVGLPHRDGSGVNLQYQ